MVRNHDSEKRRHLRLVPPSTPLPAVVPLLRPGAPVAPADDALLTALARQARLGDHEARELLWRVFAPRLEPALRRVGRMVYQPGWAWRDERPWALDDLRQEAWLVFAELIADWNGEGSFVPYITAYFSWRLRRALRRLAPPRSRVPLSLIAGPPAVAQELPESEREALLASIDAALPAHEATILRLRVRDDLSWPTIARRLGLSRRTLSRRWKHIRHSARAMLAGYAPSDECDG